MTSSPNLILSFAAGALAFLSPCILPVIPSYLTYIAGTSLEELRDTKRIRGAVILRTLLFVLGFSVVFVAMGAVVGGSGAFIGSNLIEVVNIVAGALVILLGLNMIFNFLQFLNLEKRVHLEQQPKGTLGSALIGMAFGAGWTPCVGPMLAAILFMAGSSTSAATGVVYLAAFSLGLGTPFILVALFFNRFTTALGKLRKHMKAIRIGSGVFLVLVGLLIAFGRLQVLNAAVIRWGDAIQTWAAQRPDLSTGVFAAVLALIGLLPWLVAFLRGKGVRDAGSIPKTVILALGVGTALLEIAGSISIADGLHAWLSFQGL